MFSIQYQRRVNSDNTVALFNRVLHIPKTKWRNTLAGSTVTVYEQLDGSVVVRYGPREVARFAARSCPNLNPRFAPDRGRWVINGRPRPRNKVSVFTLIWRLCLQTSGI